MLGDYFEGGEATVAVVWSDPTRADPPVDPNTGNTIVNPTTVSAVARRPDGVEVPLTVSINASPMIFKGVVYPAGQVYYARVDFPAGTKGTWSYGFTASGSFRGYQPDVLQVGGAPT